jgi:hypothetical protein
MALVAAGLGQLDITLAGNLAAVALAVNSDRDFVL